jgi:hypothetical protein
MSHLGKNTQGNLVYQLNSRDLKIGTPPSGEFGSLTVDDLVVNSGATLPPLESLTVENLTVTSGATLPAFNSLVVKPTGTSQLGTVQGDSVWQGSGIGEVYGGTGQTSYSPGDILYSDAVDSLATLPSGAAGTFLTIEGGAIVWADVLDEPNGGTGQSTYAAGDILYADGADSLATLPSGAEGTHLSITGGALAWTAPPSTIGDVLIVTAATGTPVNTDEFVMVSGVGLVTVQLPASPQVGQVHHVKDRQGIAASSGITVDGNGNLIDGAATQSLVNNYASMMVVFDGAQWNVL